MGSILKPVSGLVLVGLIILFSSLVAGLFWQFFTPKEAVPIATVSASEMSKPMNLPSVNYGKEIADLNLFGKEDRPAVTNTAKATNKSIPEPEVTKPLLNITLSSVIMRQVKPSMVIMKVVGDKAKVLFIGDKVQKGVKLIKIRAREVVLDYEGDEVVIKLPDSKESTKAKGNNAVSIVRPIQRRSRSTRMRPVNIPASQNINTVAPLPIDNLAELRNTLVNEPQRIGELIRVVEARDADQNLLGFRLSPGKNRAIFRNLGLRPGDIAIEINGTPLNSASKAFMAVSELSAATEVSLKIKRGNQIITINKSL